MPLTSFGRSTILSTVVFAGWLGDSRQPLQLPLQRRGAVLSLLLNNGVVVTFMVWAKRLWELVWNDLTCCSHSSIWGLFFVDPKQVRKEISGGEKECQLTWTGRS